jgi:hypothetical protein
MHRFQATVTYKHTYTHTHTQVDSIGLETGWENKMVLKFVVACVQKRFYVYAHARTPASSHGYIHTHKHTHTHRWTRSASRQVGKTKWCSNSTNSFCVRILHSNRRWRCLTAMGTEKCLRWSSNRRLRARRLICQRRRCVCMYLCMYACIALACAQTDLPETQVCVYACMHVCMYACMHVCMYCACVRAD